MSSTISNIDFHTEVMPSMYAINLQFISKKTNKPILTPNGASAIVRGFFANRNARASVLETYNPSYRSFDAVHLADLAFRFYCCLIKYLANNLKLIFHDAIASDM
jgi:hypothetical protein